MELTNEMNSRKKEINSATYGYKKQMSKEGREKIKVKRKGEVTNKQKAKKE
jgi:hypothetical protein